jgi:hypothetical protein
MECEVSALMGAADEELWERSGLFSSVDAMCRSKGSGRHIDERFNARFNTEDLTNTHLTVSIPFYQSVRLPETKNAQGRADIPGEDTGVFPSASKAQRIGGLARRNKVVASPNIGEVLVGEGLKEKRCRVKRSTKVWRPKRTKCKLVLGMDIGLEESCNLALCALVGRLAYRSRCLIPLEDWVLRNWEPLLGYSPEVLSLPRGWMGFVFKCPEDSEMILQRFWGYDGGSMMLKRWRLSFNPVTEYFSF